MKSLVECRIEGGVGIITLSAPPVNALSDALVTELGAAQDALEGADVAVVVIRSLLDGVFIAGADLKPLSDASLESFAVYLDGVRVVVERFSSAPYLTIAAIDGHALGGGLELALGCSLRVAGPCARLGLPEIKLGLIPGAGGTQRLSRLLPRGKALDLLLTGRSVDAAEAYALGIVDRLAEEGESGADAALELAGALARGPSAAHRAVIRCVDGARDVGFEDGMGLERAELHRLFESPDGREGIAAFLEKRAPEFGK